jgi:membrane-bound lytic murein transglycosylase MltF
MIKPTLRIPLCLLAAFLFFWAVFALVYGIQESRKVSGDYPEIAEKGILRVCGEEDRFSFFQQGDSLHGFYYEMMKAFADRHHLKLIYTSETNVSKRLRHLDAGKCDVLSGPLPIVGIWRKQINYTAPILESKWVLIQRISHRGKTFIPIRQQVDLRGKYLFTGENQAVISRIHHLETEISDTIFIRQSPGSNSERLIAIVSQGLADFAVCDKQVAKAYLSKYPNVDIKTSIGFNQLQAWGVKPGRKALLDSLNVFIADYKKSPAFARLLEKYIPKD